MEFVVAYVPLERWFFQTAILDLTQLFENVDLRKVKCGKTYFDISVRISSTDIVCEVLPPNGSSLGRQRTISQYRYICFSFRSASF